MPAHSDQRRSFALAAVLVSLALLLRVVFILWYRIDSDEPQHLHVAWAWANGLVPYHDVFDNHMPLFHLLASPLFHLFPTNADVLYWARVPMVLLFAWSLAAVYGIGRNIWNREQAAVAALLFAFFPVSALKAVEFRNDSLWIPLWMTTLFLLTRLPLRAPNLLLAGLTLGVAFCVSFKTVLLIATLSFAGIALLLRSLRSERIRASELVRILLPLVLGFAVPILIIAATFHRMDLLPAVYESAIGFNSRFSAPLARRITGAVAFPLLALLALRMLSAERPINRAYLLRPPASGPRPRFSRHHFLKAVSIFFVLLLLCFWPLITTRDFLPLPPVLVLLIAPSVVELFQRADLGQRRQLVAVSAMALVGWTVWYGALWKAPSDHFPRLVTETLRLTGPSDRVLDRKGESIFRRRASYYLFERVGHSLMDEGKLAETAPRDVVRTRACVATVEESRVPRRTLEFLGRYFIPVGAVRVCGSRLNSDGRFAIAVPARYAIVTADGPARGVLDGRRYEDPVWLEAGIHQFQPDAGLTRPLAVVWSRAIERGFSPFGGSRATMMAAAPRP